MGDKNIEQRFKKRKNKKEKEKGKRKTKKENDLFGLMELFS